MDVWALNPKAGSLPWRARKEQERGLMMISQRLQWKYFGIENGNALHRGLWQVRVSGRRGFGSLMVRATGQKKNPENPSSSGEFFYLFINSLAWLLFIVLLRILISRVVQVDMILLCSFSRSLFFPFSF